GQACLATGQACLATGQACLATGQGKRGWFSLDACRAIAEAALPGFRQLDRYAQAGAQGSNLQFTE
ncbi:MAG: hypothetical protein KDC54_15245, partial [Lewinella sp.]|nr:hypothetical protein [Lewinella sp.]